MSRRVLETASIKLTFPSRFFGPNSQPRVWVGFRNEVEVDCGGHAELATIEDYRRTVGERTWAATMTYVESLKQRKIKIAFFNSTPQGGGVALMRHALVRFLKLVGLDIRWLVTFRRQSSTVIDCY